MKQQADYTISPAPALEEWEKACAENKKIKLSVKNKKNEEQDVEIYVLRVAPESNGRNVLLTLLFNFGEYPRYGLMNIPTKTCVII